MSTNHAFLSLFGHKFYLFNIFFFLKHIPLGNGVFFLDLDLDLDLERGAGGVVWVEGWGGRMVALVAAHLFVTVPVFTDDVDDGGGGDGTGVMLLYFLFVPR